MPAAARKAAGSAPTCTGTGAARRFPGHSSPGACARGRAGEAASDEVTGTAGTGARTRTRAPSRSTDRRRAEGGWPAGAGRGRWRPRGSGRFRRATAGDAGDPEGPRRRQPRDGRSVPLSPVPCRQSDGPGEMRSLRGLKPGNHMPLPLIVPVGTGRDRNFPDAVAERARRVIQATSAPPGALRFFRLWPGWRQVALMGSRINDLRIFGRRFSDDVRRVF